MVAGMELAVILRAKGGRAFLTQSRGLDVKAATDASWEVANTLAQHSRLKGADADESEHDAPGFAAGDMPASNGRFRVVYRLANQVYVMGVAPAHGNVLFAARVVNAATHHLVSVNRGISVTPDRVANRFPEVYLAFSELIANGGKLRQATAGAEAAIDSLSSEAARTVKQLKKSFTASLSLRKSAGSITKQTQPDPSTLGGGRTLAAEVDPLMRPAFTMPEDALPPLQYVPPEKAMMAAPRAWGGFDGYRLMPLEEAAAAEEEKRKDEFLGFQPIQEPPPEAPPTSELEDIAFPETPTGPRGLWLEEFWRCHVVGGKPARMGTRGRVIGNAPASKAHLHTVFRLQPPAEANRVLEASVRAAKPSREIAISAEELAESCCVAYFDRIFGKKDPAFLEYRLPALAVPPPLQVYFLAFLSPPAEGDTRARVTLVLRYAAAASLPAPLYDVAVDVDVHPHLAAPAKVSPEATWASKQHRLRWVLPEIAAGDSGDLKAQFLPDTKTDPLASAGVLEGAAGAAVQETVLRLRFVSPPQHTLSGTRLESGVNADSMEPPEFAEFYGELTAQPELREVLW